MAKYVKCPEEFDGLFSAAEDLLEGAFASKEWNAEKGEIRLGSERYVMYRAASLSVQLRRELENLVGSGVSTVLYRFGRSCGQADAKHFFEVYADKNLDPPMKLALGPVSFALCGYALVEILPESKPSPDEDFLIVYDHTNVYESQSFLEQGIESKVPVDSLNAGYSAGWCSEAFGLQLESKEISCVAKGDAQCRFVMAHASKIHKKAKEIKEKYGF